MLMIFQFIDYTYYQSYHYHLLDHLDNHHQTLSNLNGKKNTLQVKNKVTLILLPDWLLPKSCGPPPPPLLPPYAAIAGGGRLKLPYSIDKTVAKNVIKPHFGKRKYFLRKN